jgi:LmbE family N-acetylglucosaminyl deacetylase
MLELLPGSPKEPLDVLCLGAHCDDVEIGCGGTLLRLLEERPGSRVRLVAFSSTPERERELRSAAGELLASDASAELTVHRFRESFFPWQGAPIKEAFEALRQGPSPQIVFTHRVKDLHQDHRTVGELTWNTFRDHFILEYEVPKYDGDLGQPNVFVPLSEAVARRKTAIILRHYQSQAAKTWFTAGTFEGLMRLRAVECNAPAGWAEAFHARKVVIRP